MDKVKALILAVVLVSLLLFGCVQQNDSNSKGSGLMILDANKSDSNLGANIYNNLGDLQGKAKVGDEVKVNYTGRLKDGTIFDSSVGKEPLDFNVGAHQVIRGFENAVVGMKIGETKTVELPPEQAYGSYDNSKVITFDSNSFGDFNNLQKGMTVYAGSLGGKVVEKNDTNAIIDFNHALAGKTLIFDITLVSIN